ncbi:MAG: alpha-L-fucosidase [Kiritimatiellae bacterium]|nr:alpha-L-fucosidase [Kiritimatiellia bacterium]
MDTRTAWFAEARFGMFIHWGLYALPARHEWVKHNECIADEAYDRYFDRFDPDLYDPREWARAAKAAGMKYAVLTAKHHEGFCLWDSAFTDYKAPATHGAAAGRDLLREFVDAFRAEGLRVGFYYSLLDWHHPDFTIDRLHPLRNLPRGEIDRLNAGRDMKRYAKYMRDQVTELLTNYGRIDIMWFDFSYPGPGKPGELPGKGRDDWESEKLVELVRSLQPHVLVDNRLDLPGGGDFLTPEQWQYEFPERLADGSVALWEGCQTFSGSWGYHRDEASWKSGKQCVEMLVHHVSRGGNLIMNVGPTARGRFDSRAKERLAAFAEWMDLHSRSIYGCTAAPAGFVEGTGTRYTWNPKTKRLYVHVFDWPLVHLALPGLGRRAKYAQLLGDGSEIVIWNSSESSSPRDKHCPPDTLMMALPVRRPDVAVPVVEVFLD